MMVVGLTGGMGAGKTFVADEFKKLDIPVYNSDSRAKILMETHPFIKDQLRLKFGDETFLNDRLNRKFIAEQIFSIKVLVDWINKLVHPVVGEDFEQWVAQQKADFVIKEAAILIESGAYKQCDKIIVVTADENTRIKRVMDRDNMTQKQVLERLNNQLSEPERLKFADFIIINDGIKVVKNQVQTVYDEILKLT